jgi:uncharacterized membrane protein YgdD (TMEM256/DUF423 family)
MCSPSAVIGALQFDSDSVRSAGEMGEIRMPIGSRLLLVLAALALCAAAGLGAYGAHGLAGSIPQATFEAYMTAIDYQFYHGLGLCVIAILVNMRPDVRAFHAAGYALALGIVLFCGGLVATTLGAPGGLGRIVPFGGIAFMVGWLLLGLGALLARKGPTTDSLA